ncbi:hypothetical protein BC938DRAFT_482755 [Jimgerdemannia flammicorona]|uniref:Uncharacterized protein n=1 Tax=Jimgerdemannia flammicorona TaxID=994334 RepID=A0A433R0D2_9FUNG|nr:hypothetical protein BC938DRAFT_482755 [Jimgerdemannia flammicorona]
MKLVKIQYIIILDDIQKAAFRGTTFTNKEKTVSVKIINFLQLFIQQHTDDNELLVPHILMHTLLVALANTITTITGFPSLVFDNTNWITNSYQAEKNKTTTFKTVCLLGKTKPSKTFIKSNYELRKKGKANINKFMWTIEILASDCSNMEVLAETHASQIKELTNIPRPLRKELSHRVR